MVDGANGELQEDEIQNCPPGYTHCGTQGKLCHISSTVKEGYMSYGRDGRWILAPFTNTGGNDIVIDCDNDHGNILPWIHKECCYIEASIGFDGSFSQNIIQGEGFDLDGAYGSIRYGNDSQYFYRVTDGNAFDGWVCNNWFFNKHQIGTTKHCQLWKDKPASIPATDAIKEDGTTLYWTRCGNEGNDCTGLDTTAAQWVRYGRPGYYTFRLVISARDGSIPCNSGMFE